MHQNEELYQACLTWFQAALRLLQNKPLLGTPDLEVIFHNSSWNTQQIVVPDFVQFILSNLDELNSLSETDEVVRLISATPALASALLIDAAGTPIASEASYKSWLNTVLFTKFLLVYFGQSNTVTFILTLFERLYHQLEQYIYQTEFTGVWLVHIRNLTLDNIERIQLDRHISLRRVTEAEKVSIIKNTMRFTQHFVTDLPSTFLEIHQPIDRLANPDQRSINDLIQPVVLALRLIKNNSIGVVSYQ
jgi:hypothetical protein